MAFEFDYIVVGAGSAGCVLANRLSADPANRVLLLEAGGGNAHPMIAMPLSWHMAAMSSRFGWGYQAEPESASGDRALPQPRGRLLGGTSSINGMMYSRGNVGDYDGWAQRGLSGWSYADVLPYFRRSESNWRGAGPYHGGDGPMGVSRNPVEPIIYPVMIETAKRLGYAELDDFHGPVQEGFGMPDFKVRGGRRESSASAYLKPARGRANLTVATGAHATRVLMAGKRATGVEYVQRGTTIQALARETILCGGAFNSPQTLLLSGIGDGAALQKLGIETVHHLPAVGRNLQDHPLVPMVFEAARPFGFEKLLRLDRLMPAILRWALTGKGAMGEAPLSVQGYVRAQPQSAWPDTQFQVSHVSVDARPWFPGWRAGAGHRFTAAAIQMRPIGRGDVTLRSPDFRAAPRIRLGLLEDPADLVFARDMFDFVRRFFATDPLAGLIKAELFPGAGVARDDEIDAFLRDTIQTAMHPASSCSMGVDPHMSVVDAQLRVHGITGLRVADASIMPTIVSGNTGAPATMIGEKAADMILGRSLPRDDPAEFSQPLFRSEGSVQ